MLWNAYNAVHNVHFRTQNDHVVPCQPLLYKLHSNPEDKMVATTSCYSLEIDKVFKTPYAHCNLPTCLRLQVFIKMKLGV